MLTKKWKRKVTQNSFLDRDCFFCFFLKNTCTYCIL